MKLFYGLNVASQARFGVVFSVNFNFPAGLKTMFYWKIEVRKQAIVWTNVEPGAHFTKVFRHDSNSREKFWFLCNAIIGYNIATKLCTCHDSTAVVPCAKFHSDHFHWKSDGSRMEFPSNLHLHGWIVCREMGPRSMWPYGAIGLSTHPGTGVDGASVWRWKPGWKLADFLLKHVQFSSLLLKSYSEKPIEISRMPREGTLRIAVTFGVICSWETKVTNC